VIEAMLFKMKLQQQNGDRQVDAMSAVILRAPRIISILQRLCDHGNAANEAAEQQDLFIYS
jgi:hypothetical protein